MHLLRYFILLTLPLVFSACRKDTAVNYSITGRVTDADDGTPLQDVSIQIENYYIPADKSLDIESFSNGTVTENIQLYKEAFVSLRFYHTNGNSGDRLSFTFSNADFNCNCCSNGWRTWQASNIDTTITCRVYGNRWLKYQVQTLIGFTDSSFVDSVFCDAFVTTSRDIQY